MRSFTSFLKIWAKYGRAQKTGRGAETGRKRKTRNHRKREDKIEEAWAKIPVPSSWRK